MDSPRFQNEIGNIFFEAQDPFHNYTAVFGRWYYPVKSPFFGISTPSHNVKFCNIKLSPSETLVKIIILFYLVSGAYEENKLLNRLFGSYRVSFIGGDGCSIDETEGKKLYAANPAKVPIEEGFK